jgi:hypothetical protein
LRDQWRIDPMTRDPVVTYSRRPAPPAASAVGAPGPTLNAVEVPYTDTLLPVRAAAAALRSGGVTLAVVAGVAAIAAGVAVVAASYDVGVMRTGAPLAAGADAYRSVAPVAGHAPTSVALASIAPVASYLGGYGSLPASPEFSAAEPASVAASAAPSSRAAAAKPVPVVVPPLPHLRPAVVPPPVRTALAPPPAPPRKATGPTWSVWPEASEANNADVETASTAPARPASDEGTPATSGPAPSSLIDTAEDTVRDVGDSIGGGVDSVLKNVGGLVLGALPQRAQEGIATAAAAVVAPPLPRALSAVPFVPAPPPAVIAGAPATAPTTGQLLFVLPGSATVVPATIIVVPGGEIRPPKSRVVAPPSRPRLRAIDPLLEG